VLRGPFKSVELSGGNLVAYDEERTTPICIVATTTTQGWACGDFNCHCRVAFEVDG